MTTKKESLKRCDMNKNVKNLVVAGLVCVALCGTTLAAPRGGNGGRAPGRAPTHQKAPAPRVTQHHAPTHNARHHRTTVVDHAPAPHHHAPARHVVVHHAPPPPPVPVVVHHAVPPPPPPAPVVVHRECHTGTGLGALLGAVVGAVVGAAL